MLRPPPLAPLGGTRNARLVAPCGRHGRAVVRTWVCKPWLCGELGSVADRKSGSLLRPPPLAPLRRTGNAALIALHGRHGRPVSRHWVREAWLCSELGRLPDRKSGLLLPPPDDKLRAAYGRLAGAASLCSRAAEQRWGARGILQRSEVGGGTTFRTVLLLEYLEIMNVGHGVAWDGHAECAHAALDEVQGAG